MSVSTQDRIAAGIGIDVSKDKLDLAVRFNDQNYQVTSFTNDAKGARSICGFLKRQEAAEAAPVVIESTGDYHLRSALIIKQGDYQVKVINPILTKKYQKSSVRNAKTDKIDAKRLADIAVLESGLPDFKANIAHIQSRKLASLLKQLEKSKQQLSMSIKRFQETANAISLKHPTKHFKRAITELEKQIKETKQELSGRLPEKQKLFADSTKGLSREKLAVINALVGDKIFQNADQLTAFFGLDVAIRKSGQWTGKSKLSKRGNAYARKMLYQIAWGMKTHNDIFRECYDLHRKNNRHYNEVLVILARKFLRYYFKYSYQSA